MICFTILDKTLCGKSYKEPSKKAAKDGRLCDDCIQVMWREQYRRNTLVTYVKKAEPNVCIHTSDDSPVYLRGYIAL